MTRGLNVSVEENGDLTPDTADISIRSEELSVDPSNFHSTSTVTSVSTESVSVTLQFRVCLVPSYSGPLGTLTDTDGEGTAGKRLWINKLSCHSEKEVLHSLLTVTSVGVELLATVPTGAGVCTLP